VFPVRRAVITIPGLFISKPACVVFNCSHGPLAHMISLVFATLHRRFGLAVKSGKN
jgi:hypothetical protein